jgi:hypothetical protein
LKGISSCETASLGNAKRVEPQERTGKIVPTVSNTYTFNANAVKLKRRVIAPYRENGVPKDWQETEDGNFRLTAPSNLWTDITVPFWSMPENTDHPTQKPEKLIAKLFLPVQTKATSCLTHFSVQAQQQSWQRS